MGHPGPASGSDNPVAAGFERLFRHWRGLMAFPVGTGVICIVLALILPRWYRGVTIFTPSPAMQASLTNSLQSIASQFGFNASGSSYSVYYFGQILGSREASRIVALDTLTIDGENFAVLDLLRASGSTPEKRLEDCIKHMPDFVNITTDDQSNLVTVEVLGPTPDAAVALAGAFLRAVDTITTASLKQGGSLNWRFAQAQADSALTALHTSEDALAHFYAVNRTFSSSPVLQTEEARLQRDIQIRRDIYVSLVQQAEAAKLQAVNNTPSIQLIQPPQSSIKKARPKASVWGPVGTLGAFALATGWIFFLRPLLPGEVAAAVEATPGIVWRRIRRRKRT